MSVRKRRPILRALRFLSISIFLLVATAFATLYFGLNTIVENRRGEIVAALSRMLGVPIEAGTIEASIFPVLDLEITGLKAFPSSDCRDVLSVEETRLSVALLPLFEKRIDITGISVDGIGYALGATENAQCREQFSELSRSRQEKTNAESTAPADARIALRVHSFKLANASYVTPQGRVEVPDLSARMQFANGVVELSDLEGHISTGGFTFQVEAKRFEYGKVTRLEGMTMKARPRGGTLTISGIADESGTSCAVLINRVDVMQVARIAKAAAGIHLPIAIRGLVDADVKISRPRSSPLVATGTVNAEDLSIDDGPFRYAAKSIAVKGTLTTKPSEIVANAGSTVRGFSFDDGVTRVSNVDGTLRNIVFRYSGEKGAFVKLDLDGNSCSVENPRVKVHRVTSVKAPLRIEVPAAGGYSVSGPVACEGVDVTPVGYPFEKVSGTVVMLVSGSLLRFESKGLGFLTAAQRGTLTGTYAMSAESHSASDIRVAFPFGTAEVAGNLLRDSTARFQTRLALKHVDIAQASTLLRSARKGELSGTIENSEARIEGTTKNLLDSLKAQGTLAVSRGDLRSFDFTYSLRTALSKLPGFEAPKEKAQVTQRFTTDFNVANRTAGLRNIKLQNDRYTFEAQGQVSFDGTIAMEGAVILLRESAEWLGLGIPLLQRAFGRIATIEIPITVDGRAPKPEIHVDMVKFAKKYSGLSTLEDATKAATGVVKGALDAVRSPFRRKSDAQEEGN